MNTIHSYTNDQRILDVAHKRSAPGPGGRPEHHPDDDRGGQGARPRHPRPEGQVRRLQPARPDADRQRRRLHRRRLPSDVRRGAQRRLPSRRGGAPQGHPRRQRRAARLDRLPGRQPLLDHRRRIDDGPRRDDGQGHQLVRQRVGLQLPRRRPDRLRRGPPAGRGLPHPPPRARRAGRRRSTAHPRVGPTGRRPSQAPWTS